MTTWSPDYFEKRYQKIIASHKFIAAYNSLKTVLHQYNGNDIDPRGKITTMHWHEFGILNLAMFYNFAFTQLSVKSLEKMYNYDYSNRQVFDFVREALAGMTFLVSGLECLLHSCLILYFPKEYHINGRDNDKLLGSSDYKRLYTMNRKYERIIGDAYRNWYGELNCYRNVACHSIIAAVIDDRFLNLRKVSKKNKLGFYDRRKLEDIFRNRQIYGGIGRPPKYHKSFHGQLKYYLSNAYNFATEIMNIMINDARDNCKLFCPSFPP